MNKLDLTTHAVTRMAQRGFRGDDLHLIQMIGTEVQDGYLVLDRDYQAFERETKRLLADVRRLIGARVVVGAGGVVTAYRAGKATERRLVRGTEERNLSA